MNWAPQPPQPLPPPPGWYPDPGGSGAQRWWDGAAWTEHVHPAAGALAVPGVQAGATPPEPRYPQKWWHLPLVVSLAVLSIVVWIVVQLLAG